MKNKFWTLCKYELKKSLPTHRKGKKTDWLGNIVSAIITLAIAVAFVVLLSIIAESYVEVKINKERNPLARSAELLNVLYTGIIVAMSMVCLERMRKILTESKEKEILLRLPVKPETIFLSKMTVLLMENYVMSLLLLLPASIVVYAMLTPTFAYWIYSFLVWLILPIVPIFIAAIFIIPYIKVIDFIKRRYALMFLLVTGLLCGAFWVYSKILEVVQSLLETGTIRFLFNQEFITVLQTLRKITFPANVFTNIALGINVLVPLLLAFALVGVAALTVYFITKRLFYATLYKNEIRKQGSSKGKAFKKLSPAVSLIKKECISVFRNPAHMFSYFAIGAAMPVMVYCCYTMFESLILNAIGLRIDFSLALFIVLIFSVLTNTFCATNVTRDGVSALTSKIFPIRPSRLMLAKVVFCLLVSSLSVIISAALLILATSLTVWDGLVVGALAIVFSAAQIFIATRLDLNNARLASGALEAESAANKTIAIVILWGMLLSAAAGIASLVVSMFSTEVQGNLNAVWTYLIPSVVAIGYLAFAMLYYRRNIEKSFYNLVA